MSPDELSERLKRMKDYRDHQIKEGRRNFVLTKGELEERLVASGYSPKLASKVIREVKEEELP